MTINAGETPDNTGAELSKIWHDEIKRYNNAFEKQFVRRGEKVVDRYRDERRDSDNVNTRVNILWSNVRSMKPAIYCKPPSPDVSRRFKDKDPVARTACQILERCLDFELQNYQDYDDAMSAVVEDRLLPGRGVAWVRYEPQTEPIDIYLEDQVEPGDDGNDIDNQEQVGGDDQLTDEPMEQITTETCPVDYVHWKDFAHDPVRSWNEVTWIAKRVYLTIAEGVERFGDEFNRVPLVNVPLDHKESDKESTLTPRKKAEVWEIWDKPKKRIVWIAKDWDYVLDEKPDPLNLPGFFPCPKPLYATITTDSLIPVSDYIQYQDQASELDEVSDRIRRLTKGLKQSGIYAAEIGELQRLIKEGQDTTLIPVENWQSLTDVGGLAGAIQWMPLAEAVAVLQQLYQSRKEIIEIIYEITGIPDIIRGATDPNETLGAQQLKNNNAGTRLNQIKREVAKFAADLIKIKAHIMTTLYQDQSLIECSGIQHTEDAQYIPQAIQLLRNQTLQHFVISIEDDALVEFDDQQDKANRMEFLTTVGDFFEKSMQVAQASPTMLPLMSELVMFAVRGFKIGESVEAAFENAIQQLQEQAKQAAQQPPPPNPEMIKIQAQMQLAQVKAEADKKQSETESMVKLMEMKIQEQSAKSKEEVEKMIAERELSIKELSIQAQRDQLQVQLDFDRWKCEFETAAKIEIAKMQLESKERQTETNKTLE